MRGTLKNKEGKWVVEYDAQVEEAPIKPWIQQLPLHPDSIQEDAMLYPDGYVDEKEVEFEIIDFYDNSSNLSDISHKDFTKVAKLTSPKQEESSNWDEIFKLYNYSLSSIAYSSPNKLKIWLKEHYLPPVKR